MNSEASYTREGSMFSLKALIQAGFPTGITEPVGDRLKPVKGKMARPVSASANQLRGQLVSPRTGVTTAGKTALDRQDEKSPLDRIRQLFATPTPSPQLTAAPHPWPVLDALNWTHHCAVWPEDDGSGLLLYPAAGLLASEKAAALRFAQDNLPALLRDMCLEHLPRRVRWCQCNPISAGSRRRGR